MGWGRCWFPCLVNQKTVLMTEMVYALVETMLLADCRIVSPSWNMG